MPDAHDPLRCSCCQLAAERIAELEADLARLHETAGHAQHLAMTRKAEIARLRERLVAAEAERDQARGSLHLLRTKVYGDKSLLDIVREDAARGSPIPDYRMFANFRIEDKELDGYDAHTAFVLGAEFMAFVYDMRDQVAGSKLAHAGNLRRILGYAEDCGFHVEVGDEDPEIEGFREVAWDHTRDAEESDA